MRNSVRQITMIILLTALLIPGLAHARTPIPHPAQSLRGDASLTLPDLGSFTSVWNLLTNWLKNGTVLDPSGSQGATDNSGTSTGGDNGTVLDPSGGPK
jgi:hypothetical protein